MLSVSGFQIPVLDMERAVKFYSTVFDIEISIWDRRADYGGMLGILADENGLFGTLYKHERDAIPSQDSGLIIYLNTDDLDLQILLTRWETAGGKIRLPATQIERTGKKGFIAWVVDCEGNSLGLHSQNTSKISEYPGGRFATKSA
ncbi:MAG: VOC family protein [Chloroflexota bacterium]